MGAAAAYVLLVFSVSGVIEVLDSSVTPLRHLVIGFLAGFSEKWFVARIGDVTDGAGR